MNKKAAQEELKQIEQRMAELRRIIEEPERRRIYEQPELGFTISENLNIIETSRKDTQRVIFNLYSLEMAEREAARRKVEAKLYRLAQEREKTHPVDWKDDRQDKYCLKPSWDHHSDKPDPDISITNNYESIFPAFTNFSFQSFEKFIRENLTEQELTDYCRPRRFV